MASFAYLLLSAAFLELVCCGQAWYYQSSSSQPSTSHVGTSHLSTSHLSSSHLLKNQFLLPPYPSYQHELLHQTPPPSFTVHDNRYYGSPGEFAEPTSYNELNFEGPYEVTAPRIPGLYFRLSSGVFVPVKAVYSFPPFLERIIQRIQGYYSVYNPPDALGLDRPLPDGGVPVPPLADVLPVLPPQHPPVQPGLAYIPPPPPGPAGPPPPAGPAGPPPPPGPAGPAAPSPETPRPEEPSTTEPTTTSSSSTTTESTKEETTPAGGESNEISATESIESTTDASVETTTTI